MKGLLALLLGLGLARGVELELRDGTKYEIARVKRHLPSAIQIVTGDGQIKLIRHEDIKRDSLEFAKTMPDDTTAASRVLSDAEPIPEAQTGPISIGVKIVNVGSETSTSYQWQASWGSNIRTNHGASINEARILLRSPGPLQVTVATVVGRKIAFEEVELLQASEKAIRMREETRTRKIYDLKALGILDVNRAGAKADFFVQVQKDGIVLAEAGTLPGHQPGTLLERPKRR